MLKTTLEWDNITFEKPGSYGRWQAYGTSRLFNILDATACIARLATRGITTYALHPGVVSTELMRNMTDNSLMSHLERLLLPIAGQVLLSPLQGSLTTFMCVVDPSLGTPEVTDKYWACLKEEKASAIASDPANSPGYQVLTEKVLEDKLGRELNELIP